MPDRATVHQVVQVGVEATPGTAVPANRLLQSISLEPTIDVSTTPFRAMGAKFVSMTTLNRESITARLSGAPTYNELPYLFSSALAYAAPVQVTPPSGLAYRWTFTPSQSSPDTVKTYTVEQGSSARAHRWTHGIFTDLTLTFNRDGFDLDGEMLGQRLEDDITLTASPTTVGLVPPVLPTEMSAYLDTAAGSIGTTQLTRLLAASVRLQKRFGPVWALDSSRTSFASVVELAPTAEVTMLMEADAQGMAVLGAMRAGDRRYLRLRATGPNIEGSTAYQLTIDAAITISGVSAFRDEGGVYALEWTGTITYDAAWGKAITVDLINKLSAL